MDLLVRGFIAWPMKDEDMTSFILLINDKSEISVIKEATTATSSSLQTVHREIQWQRKGLEDCAGLYKV